MAYMNSDFKESVYDRLFRPLRKCIEEWMTKGKTVLIQKYPQMEPSLATIDY